jgi:hypothetical protein
MAIFTGWKATEIIRRIFASILPAGIPISFLRKHELLIFRADLDFPGRPQALGVTGKFSWTACEGSGRLDAHREDAFRS